MANSKYQPPKRPKAVAKPKSASGGRTKIKKAGTAKPLSRGSKTPGVMKGGPARPPKGAHLKKQTPAEQKKAKETKNSIQAAQKNNAKRRTASGNSSSQSTTGASGRELQAGRKKVQAGVARWQAKMKDYWAANPRTKRRKAGRPSKPSRSNTGWEM